LQRRRQGDVHTASDEKQVQLREMEDPEQRRHRDQCRQFELGAAATESPALPGHEPDESDGDGECDQDRLAAHAQRDAADQHRDIGQFFPDGAKRGLLPFGRTQTGDHRGFADVAELARNDEVQCRCDKRLTHAFLQAENRQRTHQQSPPPSRDDDLR